MSKAIKYIDLTCLTAFFSLLLVAIFFGLSQDLLLFNTDPVTLIYFIVGIGFIVSLVLIFPLMLVTRLVPGSVSQRIGKALALLSFGLILFGFLANYLDNDEVFNYTLDRLKENFFHGDRFSAYVKTALMLYLSCFLLGLLLSRFLDMKERITSLARVITSLALVFVLFFQLHRWFSPEALSASPPKQNMILIVLDGLSAKYLDPYNPAENTPFFKEIASESVVYTNIRTNFAYTSGFFYALYSGKKNFWDKQALNKKAGLLSALQAAGVNTRWYTYHNNGVPDIFNFEYSGLRTTFLIGNLAWVPRSLGVDYNIFEMPGAFARGRSMGYREAAINDRISRIQDDSYMFPLEKRAVEEVQLLRKDSRPFFLTLHLPVSALTVQDPSPKIWELEDGSEVPEDAVQKVRQKILKHQDYTYTEEDNRVVEILREKYRKTVQAGTRSLKKFYDIYKQKGWDKDTLLIVTADHGKIFSKGKIAYGFHNDEEVARVPFLVHWQNRVGEDDRLGETIDITQTALDFFQVEQKFSENAISLLDDKKKKRVTTLTRRSLKKKKWYLNVYEDGQKLSINLFSENLKIQKEAFSGYFDTVAEGKAQTTTDSLDFNLNEMLEDYGIHEDKKKSRLSF